MKKHRKFIQGGTIVFLLQKKKIIRDCPCVWLFQPHENYDKEVPWCVWKISCQKNWKIREYELSVGNQSDLNIMKESNNGRVFFTQESVKK